LVGSTSPSPIHAAVLVGDARPVGADVVDTSLGGAHAGTHGSTAAISRGPRLIDSGIHDTNAGRTTAAVSQGSGLVDAGVDCTTTRRSHARRRHSSRRCRARNAPYRNARGRAVDGLGGSRSKSCGNGEQQRGCLQHFCAPFMVGCDAVQPAGTVSTGETCPLPLSVNVNRNIRNENTPFDGRSRSSIQNQ
jgi:hypothetical protein